MAYTVKALAELAGVSVRTLHYYHEIDLLDPAHVGENGYRYYDRESLYQLQQILFFRELGFSLDAIRDVLHSSDFDRLHALETHRAELHSRIQTLGSLIETIDKTIANLKGETTMSDEELFHGFNEEKQAEYEQEIEETYGTEKLNESRRRWGSYSDAKKQAIMEEGGIIFTTIGDHMDEGHDSPAVQAQVAALQHMIHYFYDCPLDCLRGLGQMYVNHPKFNANFQAIRAGLPEFLQQAIDHYCDTHAV